MKKVIKASAGLLGIALISVFVIERPQATPPPATNPFEKEFSEKSCNIFDDADGIAHVRAQDEITSVTCLGYLHGRDRAWQMDYFRKTAEGRKAEFFGTEGIESDFIFRLLDFNGRAENLFKSSSSDFQKLLWAYSFGVNRGFAVKKGTEVYPPYQIVEPWDPKDTLALILLQSFDQTRRSFQVQVTAETRKAKYGDKASELFSIAGLPWSTTILKEGEYPRQELTESATEPTAQALPMSTWNQFNKYLPSLVEGSGSNNWVIAPNRSQTKHAWMANDPHLELRDPPFWYWVHLNGGKLDAIGATFAGVPFIVSGANRHLSWGLTNAYLPVARVYRVPLKEVAEGKTVRPKFWVKFWKIKIPFFFKSARLTPEGHPILPISKVKDEAIVLRWTGFELGAGDLTGLYDLLYANTVEEGDQALAKSQVPAWNFVFADDQGRIGYRAMGKTPRWNSPAPYGIPKVNLSQVQNLPDFLKPLSADEMPHVVQPKRGFVVTANNAQTGPDSRWNFGNAQAQGFRAYRIEELLDSIPRHDLKSIQKIQCDVQAVDAKFLVPELLKWMQDPAPKEAVQKALDALRKWDYTADEKCTACAVYRRWVSRIYESADLDPGALYRILLDPKRYAQTEANIKELLSHSLELALADLGVGQRSVLPVWGDIHRAPFRHLSQPGTTGKSDQALALPTPGDDQSVNPGTATWTGQYFLHNYGASQRIVVEMTSPPTVYSVLPGPNRYEKGPKTSPDSPWNQWRGCELRRRSFPLDWAQVRGVEAVHFSQ